MDVVEVFGKWMDDFYACMNRIETDFAILKDRNGLTDMAQEIET